MKKFLWVLTAVITALILVVCPFFIKRERAESGVKSVVITIWNVDSFEGGKGSRTTFLRRRASEFSKRYKNVSFLVSSYTIEGVKSAVESGKTPDIISYGGCSLNLENHAEKIDFTVSDGGELSKGKRYAVSYLKGCYFRICKGAGEDLVILSKSEFTSPEIAGLFSGVKGRDYQVLSPIKAYNLFTTKKDAVMIGTQRDVIRLINNEQAFTLTPILEYSDLYQYLSLTAKGDSEKVYAREFISYLLSDKAQDKLTSLNMFSVNKTGLYTGDEHFSKSEVKPKYTFSPYALKSEYDSVCQLAFSSLTRGCDYDEIVKYLKQL